MYRYELLNNHHIVFINNKKFLIDTGFPISFSFNSNLNEITIDDKTYYLQPKPSLVDSKCTFELVGTTLDGFIGMDIILKTSLTIYKNGFIDFKPLKVDGGKEIKLISQSPAMTIGTCEGITEPVILDTGAMYGYGVRDLFIGKTPSELNVKDYNPAPQLKCFQSDKYNLSLSLGGITRNVDICYNPTVERIHLNQFSAMAVVSITEFFEEVCVFDFRRNLLILK